MKIYVSILKIDLDYVPYVEHKKGVNWIGTYFYDLQTGRFFTSKHVLPLRNLLTNY